MSKPTTTTRFSSLRECREMRKGVRRELKGLRKEVAKVGAAVEALRPRMERGLLALLRGVDLLLEDLADEGVCGTPRRPNRRDGRADSAEPHA